jgi:hypothetical protein
VNDDGGSGGHQTSDKVERADAALDQPTRSTPGARGGGRDRVAARNKGGEKREGAKDAMAIYRAPSYFDGHFAMMLSALKPSGPSRPFTTTSAPPLKVSGTTPV